MPNYLHPGVYIEEIAGGARPIEAAGTSTAAFVGIAARGPIDEPTRVTNFTEFQQIYGGYVSDPNIGGSYLAYSVFQFFQNGGTACYVVRVEDSADTAELKLYTAVGQLTTTVKAVTPGSWGNSLRIAIAPATASANGFDMYILDSDEIVEAYNDLSMVDSDLSFLDRVSKRSAYIRTESISLPDNPTFTGLRNLSTGMDLMKVKRIKLQVDSHGPYEIDCAAGAVDVSAVTASEIAKNINEAFAEDIRDPVATAVTVAGQTRIRFTSPTKTSQSQIVLTAPSAEDATYDIFGLQESSWQLSSATTTLARALGLAAPQLNPGAAQTLTLAVGEGVDVSVTLMDGVSLMDAVATINSSVVPEIAYTDGIRLVLTADEDIHIRRNTQDLRTAVQNIFGATFYSYVHSGSGGDPASITGAVDISAGSISGQLKLKIDTTTSFLVDVEVDTGTSNGNAVAVADAINAAYQKASRSEKKVAQANGARIALSSITTGTGSRIIASSHTGMDLTNTILGPAYKNNADFLVPAESQSVARLDGPAHARTDTIGVDLADRALRLSADSDPVQFSVPNEPAWTFERLFTDVFQAQADLNHKLLAKPVGTNISAHLIVSSLTAKPELHFSVPLLGGDETAKHDETAHAHEAYVGLFGDQAPFIGNARARPYYRYRRGLPDTNPVENVVVRGEELEFTSAQSLSGGGEDRSSENRLRALTVGSAPGVASGLKLLDKLTDVSLLVIPGWSEMKPDTAKRLINAGMEYCEKQRPTRGRPLQDLFYITNTPADVTTPTAARDFAKREIFSSAGGYTAIYYPWVEVADPIGKASTTIAIPPAGGIAGLYATTDSRRGVWKSPAGTEASLVGVMRVVDQVTDAEQDILNPVSVNAIRRLSGVGVVSWGARTLNTNAEWKYVAVRRTAIMLEVSIYDDIQWAVFEPNDERLWSALRLNIESFLNGLFRAGAFQGNKASDAYFVRCSLGDTMTQGDIDRGQVIILVGFAPLKPAEFVIVRIQQKAGQQ